VHKVGPEARSRDRYRRIALTSASLTAAKVIGMAVSLVTVRLTLSYLGVERYGLWMTVSSVSTFLAFADLGMGNGLLNAISEANGRNDPEAAKRCVASIFYFLMALAAASVVVLCAFYGAVPWWKIYNVHSSRAIAESGPATGVFLLTSMLAMPLSVVQKVQLGFQEGFFSGLWQSLGSVLSLAGTLIVLSNKGSLVWLISAFSGGQVLALAINAAHQFLVRRPWLLPRLANFSWVTCRSLARVGTQFLVLQIICLVGFSTDTIILAQKVGPASVAQYAIIQKLSGIAMSIQIIGVSPLWPAYTEALARKEHAWIKRTFYRSVIACVCIGIFAAVPQIVFGNAIIRFWTKTSLNISLSAFCAAGVWLVLYGYGAATATLMNGVGQLKVQIVSGALFALASIVAKLAIARQYGVAGVIWATVVTYTIFVVVPVWFVILGVLKRPLSGGSATETPCESCGLQTS